MIQGWNLTFFKGARRARKLKKEGARTQIRVPKLKSSKMLVFMSKMLKGCSHEAKYSVLYIFFYQFQSYGSFTFFYVLLFSSLPLDIQFVRYQALMACKIIGMEGCGHMQEGISVFGYIF